MVQVINTIVLNGPLLAVFELVTTTRLWTQWHPATIGVGGVRPLQLGDQMRERAPIGTQTYEGVWTVVEHERPIHALLRGSNGRIRYVPDAVVTHHEAKSSEQATARRHIHFNTSKVRYARKYFGAGWAVVLRRYILWEFRSQRWLEQLKYWLGHKRNLRAARIAAYQQVVDSGLR